MVCHAFQTREEWLQGRTAGIGGSDAPIVMGVSPYSTPLDLWLLKTGQEKPVEVQAATNRAAMMGHRLESIVAQEFAETNPWATVRDPEGFVIHECDEWPTARATVDRHLDSAKMGPGILEIKTTSAYLADNWGENEVPHHVMIQTQHTMWVCGVTWGAIAVLIGGRDYKQYLITRDDSMISLIEKCEKRFWECVEQEVQPPMVARPETAKALERLHPDDNGQTIILPGDLFALDEEYQELTAKQKRIDERIAQIKAEIQCQIGAATFGELPGVARWSWKTQERSEYTAKAWRGRVLRRSSMVKKSKKKGG